MAIAHGLPTSTLKMNRDGDQRPRKEKNRARRSFYSQSAGAKQMHRSRMSKTLHFTAVKKSRHENTFALSETVRSEVVSLLPLSVRQPKRAGGHVWGTKAKPLAGSSADGFAYMKPLSFMTTRRLRVTPCGEPSLPPKACRRSESRWRCNRKRAWRRPHRAEVRRK